MSPFGVGAPSGRFSTLDDVDKEFAEGEYGPTTIRCCLLLTRRSQVEPPKSCDNIDDDEKETEDDGEWHESNAVCLARLAAASCELVKFLIRQQQVRAIETTSSNSDPMVVIKTSTSA